MRKLSIVAYLDGKPGHDKQTGAVIRALEGMTAIETRSVRLPSERPSERLLSWLDYLFGRKLRSRSAEEIDLVIGAGRRTHLPMLRTKQNAPGARTVVCMAPGRLLIDRFDLCLVPCHDGDRNAGNIFRTVGPPCISVNRRAHRREKGLILIGGIDEKSHFWNGEKIVGQIIKLTEIGSGLEWTVSSSRRTPEATIRQLEQVAAEREKVVFFRAEDTPAGWIEEQYGLSRTVWVSADSVSMIYEALAAGCRVGVLPVTWKRKKSKFQRGLSVLREKNLVLFFEEWLAGKHFPVEEIELDEAARCAREILRRWWPERLRACHPHDGHPITPAG